MYKLLLFSLLITGTHFTIHAETGSFNLDDSSTPLTVRQLKASELLKSWSFSSTDLHLEFPVTEEEDVESVQRALDNLLRKQVDFTSSAKLSARAEHYFTWAIARAQMLNDLDFAEDALRHFYFINPTRYPCEPTARVSELLLPNTYIDGLRSTGVLAKLTQRLKDEDFARVSYEITDRFGKPDTGLKGEVRLRSVGEERFGLYQQAQKSGGVGGPYKVPEGYLFVQVHSISSGADDCFSYHRDQVVQDYGREWLKKIYNDTLTTAMRELQLDVREFTTGTSIAETAFVVDGHAVTFSEARAMLPFLFGNEKDPRFWKSIQRQALEIELIYHSAVGEAIRESQEFENHCNVLLLIEDAKARLPKFIRQEITTNTLNAWFQKNRDRYATPQAISYTLYSCASTTSSMNSADDAALCAARLERLQASGGATDLLTGLTKDEMTSQTWVSRSREIQVAVQSIEEGEWSKVFSVNGNPQVLLLEKIDRKTPDLEDVRELAAQDFEMEVRMKYWRDFAGITKPLK